MARIRTIKPDLAKHEGLFDLEMETGLPIRFAWAVLPTACDREGRFKWLPRTLKADLLPHDDLDFSRVLDAWVTRGFVVKYRVGNAWFGWLPTFRKHQVVNVRESVSELPGIEEADEVVDLRNQQHIDACCTREPRVNDAISAREVHAHGEGKGREGKGREVKPPPAGGATDPIKDEVWATGLRLLEAQGMGTGLARSFLGKLVKDYGQLLVLQAVRDCDATNPAEARAWLMARCQERRAAAGSKQVALEAANAAAGERWLRAEEARDATG